jgi:hypothetical protein
LGAEKKDNTERIRLSSTALDLALKASGRVDVFRRLRELAAAVSPLLSAPDNERFLKLMESA